MRKSGASNRGGRGGAGRRASQLVVVDAPAADVLGKEVEAGAVQGPAGVAAVVDQRRLRALGHLEQGPVHGDGRESTTDVLPTCRLLLRRILLIITLLLRIIIDLILSITFTINYSSCSSSNLRDTEKSMYVLLSRARLGRKAPQNSCCARAKPRRAWAWTLWAPCGGALATSPMAPQSVATP